MRELSKTSLTSIRRSAVGSMQDRCRIGRPVMEVMGMEPVETEYVWGSEIPCGIQVERTSRDAESSEGMLPLQPFTVRLPFGTEVTGRERIVITQRYFVVLGEPMLLRIEGIPAVGLTGLVLRCSLATEGSRR